MYNRYVQGQNGTYERYSMPDVSEAKKSTTPAPEQKETKTTDIEIAQQQNCPSEKRAFGLDVGDLLLLCIVILLVLDSDEEDIFPILIMAAAFLLQQ